MKRQKRSPAQKVTSMNGVNQPRQRHPVPVPVPHHSITRCPLPNALRNFCPASVREAMTPATGTQVSHPWLTFTANHHLNPTRLRIPLRTGGCMWQPRQLPMVTSSGAYFGETDQRTILTKRNDIYGTITSPIFIGKDDSGLVNYMTMGPTPATEPQVDKWADINQDPSAFLPFMDTGDLSSVPARFFYYQKVAKSKNHQTESEPPSEPELKSSPKPELQDDTDELLMDYSNDYLFPADLEMLLGHIETKPLLPADEVGVRANDDQSRENKETEKSPSLQWPVTPTDDENPPAKRMKMAEPECLSPLFDGVEDDIRKLLQWPETPSGCNEFCSEITFEAPGLNNNGVKTSSPGYIELD